MSAKPHPGQCREPPPSPSGPGAPRAVPGLLVLGKAGSANGSSPRAGPAQLPGAGSGLLCLPAHLERRLAPANGSPTLAFILAVGSNKLRCPGTLELIKPATETCRKLEPRLKKKKGRKKKKKTTPISWGQNRPAYSVEDF